MERPVSAPCLGDPAFVPADRVRPRVIPRDDPNSKVLGGVWVPTSSGFPEGLLKYPVNGHMLTTRSRRLGLMVS